MTVPDSVTSIGNFAFSGCTCLKSVTIPDSVASIGYSAFSGCENLKSVYITDLAAWCNIYFSGGNSNPLCFGGNLYINDNLVTDIIIPDTVTSINSYAFYGCTNLTSISVSKSVTSIEYSSFYGCANLTEIIVDDSNNYSRFLNE